MPPFWNSHTPKVGLVFAWGIPTYFPSLHKMQSPRNGIKAVPYIKLNTLTVQTKTVKVKYIIL